MGGVQVKGGRPSVFLATVSNTAATKHRFPFITNWIKLRAAGAVKMYFSSDDATADANYVTVPAPAASTPYGEWEGPLELEDIWLKGASGSVAIELVATQRRG